MSEQDMLQDLLGDEYLLNWVVGNGGMSTVWLADDIENEREVAVKVLRPEFSDNVEFLSRFRNEALASEDIRNDNVVETYNYKEVTDDSGRTFCFIVMEFIRGESLADMLIRKGSLLEPDALDILEQAAHGLAAIHERGLVHRDIKPGNLLITQNGKVKITDFGIAKAAAAAPLTRTGMVVGTAQYVSPEQAQGKDVTTATDVYSLGVVGYEMLAGKRPFSGDSSVSVAIAHINQAPPALPTSISAPTRELIGIALRKEPEHRYSDGAELEKAVAAARLGKRPPQPVGVATPSQRMEETSATAQTSQIPATDATTIAPQETTGPRTNPPTTPPARANNVPARAASATIAPPRKPRPHPQPEPEEESRTTGLITGIGISIVLAIAVIVGMYYFSGGKWTGKQQPKSSSVVATTTSSSPRTVTVTQDTPVQQAPQVPDNYTNNNQYEAPSQPTVQHNNQSTVGTPSYQPTYAQPTPTPTVVITDLPTAVPTAVQPPVVTEPTAQPDPGDGNGGGGNGGGGGGGQNNQNNPGANQ